MHNGIKHGSTWTRVIVLLARGTAVAGVWQCDGVATVPRVELEGEGGRGSGMIKRIYMLEEYSSCVGA